MIYQSGHHYLITESDRLGFLVDARDGWASPTMPIDDLVSADERRSWRGVPETRELPETVMSRLILPMRGPRG